jgi:hypothetical protein
VGENTFCGLKALMGERGGAEREGDQVLIWGTWFVRDDGGTASRCQDGNLAPTPAPHTYTHTTARMRDDDDRTESLPGRGGHTVGVNGLPPAGSEHRRC